MDIKYVLLALLVAKCTLGVVGLATVGLLKYEKVGKFGQPVTGYYAQVAVGPDKHPMRVGLDIDSEETWFCGAAAKDLLKNPSVKPISEQSYTISHGVLKITGKVYQESFEFLDLTDHLSLIVKTKFLICDDDKFDFGPSVDGVLALSINTPFVSDFLDSLHDQELLEPKYGLSFKKVEHSGHKYAGELTFGGPLEKRYTGLFSTLGKQTQWVYSWSMNIENASFGSLILGGARHVALSTATSDTLLPERFLEKVRDHLNATLVELPTTTWKEVYAVDCKSSIFFPPIEFFGHRFRMQLKAHHYVGRMTHPDGHQICYLTLFPSHKDSWTFGTNFLSQYYTLLDYKDKSVKFALHMRGE